MPAIPAAASAASDEAPRRAAVHELRALDAVPEPACDDIVLLAARICGTPVSLVSLGERERQRVSARLGLGANQSDRCLAFCAHAIDSPEPLFVVDDTHQDPRFRDHPLVAGAPHIRFFAGAAIAAPGGHAAGTVCVIDTVPRTLDAAQRESLQALARQAAALIELGETRHRLEGLARVDALTGLPNQRQFDERIHEAMQRSRRTMRAIAVMFLDIDHFKAINDAHGHAGGDAVLREFARRLKAGVRVTDVVARHGDDRFVIVLEGVDGVLELGRLADKIVGSIRPRFQVGDTLLSVTASAGLAIYRGTEHQSAADILALADAALRKARQQGRNRFALA